MRYSEQFMEHIEYAFNAFCKIVLRHEAINAWQDLKRKEEREISFEHDIGCTLNLLDCPSAAETERLRNGTAAFCKYIQDFMETFRVDSVR